MNDEQKAVIDRTVTIQRMVKGKISPEAMCEQVKTLQEEVVAAYRACYKNPDLIEERRLLAVAVESRQEYVLYGKNGGVFFALEALNTEHPRHYHVYYCGRVYARWFQAAAEVLAFFDEEVEGFRGQNL